MKVAFITTVHNRKEKTRKAVESLIKSVGDIEYKFFICDDGSTDGTKEMLEEYGNSVCIIPGDGNLFWSKGIYCAMEKALNEYADLYIMFNDDVEFFENAVTLMISSYYQSTSSCGIVGSTKSRQTGLITYGGRKLADNHLIIPNQHIVECDLANWNCFLIDNNVIESIGLIDNYYEHGLGDFDYSLQMKTAGIPIYVACDFIGFCENNSKNKTYHDKTLPRGSRFKLMISRQNLPIKSRWHYYMKNFGIKGLKSFLWPYIKCSICILLGKDY